MLNNELISSAPGWGAALPGAHVSVRAAEPSGIGHGWVYAPPPSLGYAAVATATAAVSVLGVNGATGTSSIVTGKAWRQAPATGLPTNDNRKQFTQMKTRVNVDGDGAPGPEPEREQA